MRTADAEDARRPAAIAVDLLEHAQDGVALQALEDARDLVAGGYVGAGREADGRWLHRLGGLEDRNALDHVLQLAHVSWSSRAAWRSVRPFSATETTSNARAPTIPRLRGERASMAPGYATGEGESRGRGVNPPSG